MAKGTIEPCVRFDVVSQRNPDSRFREMNRSQSYQGRPDRRWLSQLLDGAAFPALLLAVAVSQLNIGHHEKDALRQLRQQSNGVQFDNGFAEGADKYGARAATDSPRFKEETGSEKELVHNQ